MSDHFDKIELYAQDKMSVNERMEFESQLNHSAALQQAFEQYQMANDALELGVEHQLRAHLKELNQKSTEKKDSERKFIGFRLMAVAASLALIVVLGYWLLQSPSGTNQFALNEMYQSVDLSSTRGEHIPKSLAEGFDLVKLKNIDGAITFFSDVIEEDRENYTAHFILGDLYHTQGQFAKAKKEMAVVLDGQSLIWFEKAQLNYLLLSAETGWDDRSNDILREILMDENHPYLELVKQIELQQLQK